MLPSSQIPVTKSEPDIHTLCRRMEQKDLLLSPKFQRNPGIWSAQQRSRLIESIILGIPIPPVFVAVDGTGVWEVIDGLQRLDTIRNFVAGSFPLSNLEYVKEYHGYRFGKLPLDVQRRFQSSALTVFAVPSDTPTWGEKICNAIFARINGGLPLNPGERARGVDEQGYLRALGDSLVAMVMEVGRVHHTSKRGSTWKIGIGVVLGMLGKRHDTDVSFAGLPFITGGSNPGQKYMKALQDHLEHIGHDGRANVEIRARQTLRDVARVFGPTALKSWPNSRNGFPPSILQAYIVNHMDGVPADVALESYKVVCQKLRPWNFDRSHMVEAIAGWHEEVEERLTAPGVV